MNPLGCNTWEKTKMNPLTCDTLEQMKMNHLRLQHLEEDEDESSLVVTLERR